MATHSQIQRGATSLGHPIRCSETYAGTLQRPAAQFAIPIRRRAFVPEGTRSRRCKEGSMNVPKNLSAFIGKGEDYHWFPNEPAPAKPTMQTQPEPVPEPAAPWKFGQFFKPELLNSDHKEWARQFQDVCQASPEWHADQERRAAENAERKRKREAREAERRERKLNRRKAA
jgi:hypothetical protein